MQHLDPHNYAHETHEKKIKWHPVPLHTQGTMLWIDIGALYLCDSLQKSVLKGAADS